MLMVWLADHVAPAANLTRSLTAPASTQIMLGYCAHRQEPRVRDMENAIQETA